MNAVEYHLARKMSVCLFHSIAWFVSPSEDSWMQKFICHSQELHKKYHYKIYEKRKEKKMFCAIYGSIDCEWILDWCRNENLLFSNVFYFTMSEETENETHISIHTIKRKILFITSRMSWRQGHIENIVLLICGYFLIRKNLIRIFIWLTMILSDIT